MNWKNVTDTLARHRSELERIKTEAVELLDALDDDRETDAKARIIHENIDEVIRDLELTLIGVGASRRMAEREAFRQGGTDGSS